jgi:hypothetical protein
MIRPQDLADKVAIDAEPSKVTLSLTRRRVSYHQPLTPAEARCVAHALLRAANAAETGEPADAARRAREEADEAGHGLTSGAGGR